jgi:hypothetical protein
MSEEDLKLFLKQTPRQVVGYKFLNSSFSQPPSFAATYSVSGPSFFPGVPYNTLPYSSPPQQHWSVAFAPAPPQHTNFNSDMKRSHVRNLNFVQATTDQTVGDEKSNFKFSPYNPMMYQPHSSSLEFSSAPRVLNQSSLGNPNQFLVSSSSSSSATASSSPLFNRFSTTATVAPVRSATDSPSSDDEKDKCNLSRKPKNSLRLDSLTGKKKVRTLGEREKQPLVAETKSDTTRTEKVEVEETSRRVKSRQATMEDSEVDSIGSESKCNSFRNNIMKEAPGQAVSKKADPLKLTGHLRLIIQFSFIGKKGKYPQTCGNGNKIFIPERLAGFHTAYHQRWGFEVKHGTECFEKNGLKCVCLIWTITNVASGNVHSLTETPKEAFTRCSHGRTIASKVFREAMLHEANELEKHLGDESDEFRSANIQSLIKALRPKNFSEGLLVFGLQHERVQEEINF